MKKFFIGIIVVALIGGMVLYNINKNSDTVVTQGSVYKGKAISVKAVTIENGSIASYVTAPGRVKEINKAQVFFDTPLRVLEVFVDKNGSVQKGDKLLELDTSNMIKEMDRLKVQKEIQSITLKKLESGQSLLSLDTQLTSAKNALSQAQENYQKALDEYSKQQKLYESGIIPKTQLDQYERSAEDIQTAVNNAQHNVDAAQKAYESSLGSHDLDIQAQVKNLELVSSQITDIEKELSKIRKLEKAPISGYVTDVNVIEGGYTLSGQPAFTIIDAENLEITATVNEYNTKHLGVEQQVKITGEALGDETELSGKIVSVAPIATSFQSSSGIETVVEIVIEPLNGVELLKPGLNVDCDIVTQEKNDVPVAEFNIFMDDKERKQYVMIIDPESMTIQKKYVTLGIYSDMFVEIVDGLKAGDMVVVDPQPSYKDGDRIKIVE